MVPQRTNGVSTEDEDAEDDGDNENYKNNITGKHKAIRQNKSVGIEEYLYDDDKVESKVKIMVIESFLYASGISTEKRFNFQFYTHWLTLSVCYVSAI